MKNESHDKNIQERKSRIVYRIVAALFVGIVLVLAAASIIKPDVKFSEEENRILTSAPKLSAEGVIGKEYMTNLESYTADQIFLRDFWIKMKVQSDLLLGKREFNGVYLGKDKYLMQIPTEPDKEQVEKNVKAMKSFAGQNDGITVNAMIVPNAAYVMKEYLAKGTPVRDQEKDLKELKKGLGEDVNLIDVTKTFEKHVDEGLYYKTDHHWTSRGAAYGFAAAADQLGIDGAIGDYDIYTVTTEFSGTLASKSGYHKAKDTIEIYAPKGDKTQYLVSDSDNEEKRPTVYDKDALKKKDQYEVFFGGNHAVVDITTANVTKKKLLVFKDSYANSFVPFLIPYYNEIIMIDPRYYYDNVSSLIENKNITDVLFLYNLDTFLNDNSIADVLAEE